ncbi:MAG: hypothetical protein HOA04_05280 [Euryarchaeota archaeon]|nr:hypothetical protein [Euryarchaeota archaeon]
MMSVSEAPEVQVENQLIRFIPATPVDPEKAIELLGAIRSGDYVINSLEHPKATILIDFKGRFVIHGTIKQQAARAAAREFLLRLGYSDEGLTSEKGPVVASFSFKNRIDLNRVPIYLKEATLDSKLDCLRVLDSRHNLELLFFANGKVISTNARHANMVAMAAIHWRDRLQDNGLFIEE